jgi:formyl-CoA transferase
MLLAIGNDGQFARFCAAVGQPKWAQDARFATNSARVQHREILAELLQGVTRTRSTAQWIALLQDKAVPCGPINDLAQAFDDVQVQARALHVRQPLAPEVAARTGVASVSTVASPLRLMEAPPVLRHAPPALGQHTHEILQQLGRDAAAIAALRQAGIV